MSWVTMYNFIFHFSFVHYNNFNLTGKVYKSTKDSYVPFPQRPHSRVAPDPIMSLTAEDPTQIAHGTKLSCLSSALQSGMIGSSDLHNLNIFEDYRLIICRMSLNSGLSDVSSCWIQVMTIWPECHGSDVVISLDSVRWTWFVFVQFPVMLTLIAWVRWWLPGLFTVKLFFLSIINKYFQGRCFETMRYHVLHQILPPTLEWFMFLAWVHYNCDNY